MPQIGITIGRVPPDPGGGLGLAPYLRALTAAGASPLLLSVTLEAQEFDELSARVAGLVFPGGGDLDPGRFGEPASEGLRDLDAERDERELTLARRAAETGRPFLAICRGLQVVNVALGGSLIQDLRRDLPGSLVHEAPDGLAPATHPVDIDPSSHLREILACEHWTTNSFHHQAVGRLGAGLAESAHTSDGVVEGLELLGHPFGLAVQWHPERMGEDPGMQSLFRAFVAAASKQAGRHG
ncbi:MAG: hypothetical protein A2Y93_01335 [Chloroflexi bacterium RBG_13_68_17]|nr:MAG: hypothetical protein A2Y93_01335 [Chloroflexi bacterium RBG_13_68_17]